MNVQSWRLAGTLSAAVFTLALAGCGDSQSSWFPAQSQSAPVAGDSGANPPRAAASRKKDPKLEEVIRMREPNVTAISCLYDPFNPWRWNADHTEIRGVRVGALYLLGPESTGVFGDGIIRARLLVLHRDQQGKADYKLVKEWSYTTEEAIPFRGKRRTRWGWGYGLYLSWGDLDLTGRDIRLIISFERNDGLVVVGSKKDWRVPEAMPQKR